VFVYHTLRDLHMVSLIHERAKNVNLFQLTPLYAFSGLTARTGISLLLLNYFSVLTDPATFVNRALFGLTIFTSLGAVLCFVLPLRGMHQRIVSEKKRLFGEANTRLEAAIQQIYQRADTQNLAGIDQLNQLMASLVTTREELKKIPTWPWETSTLTGFITLFLLPFIIRLIGWLLEQLFLYLI
jgi:preprotein translocase subunit SecE